MWVFPCVFLIFVWVSYRWRNRRHIAMLKQIKCGIKAYPFIGHAYKFLKGDGVSRMNVIEEFGNEAIKQGGLTHVLLGNVHFTVLVDPDNIQVVMKTCLEKDDVMRFTRDLIGNGTVVAPVAIWRPRRKVLAPIFSPKNLYNFGHIFSKQSQHFVENLQEVAGRGPTSLTKYISSYAMDSICETALGVITQTEEKNKFLECFEECSRLVAKRMFQPWLYPEAIYKPVGLLRTASNSGSIEFDSV